MKVINRMRCLPFQILMDATAYGGFSNAGHDPALHSTQSSKLDSTRAGQYLPSNAKIGLRCFHAPAVKSGNSSVWKLLAIDCSLNGVIALQVTAS